MFHGNALMLAEVLFMLTRRLVLSLSVQDINVVDHESLKNEIQRKYEFELMPNSN